MNEHAPGTRDRPRPNGAWPERPDDWQHDAPDPPDAFQVPFTWRQGLLLALWSILAQFTALVPFLALGVEPEAGTNMLVFLLVSQAVTFLGVYLYLRSRDAWTWHLLGPVRPAWKHLWVGVGVGVVGYLIVVVLGALAFELVGPFEPPDQPFVERTLQGGLATVIGVIVTVGVGPVIEELIYRGVLFQGLRQRVGLWPAMGLSAIVFGVVHFLAPFYIAVLAILGFWFAGAFHRTGTLVVPILGHVTFNAIQLTIGLLVVTEGGG